MFLDDELLDIGRNAEMTEKGLNEAVDQMIKCTFGNLLDRMNGSNDWKVLVSNFKRVNNQWKSVANILKQENKGFIKPDGFENFVKSDIAFHGISEYL